MEPIPKKVYLYVVGCPENRYDLEQVKTFLVKRGAETTTNPGEADTIIINTCGLTRMNEKLSVEITKKLQQNSSPDSKIIVCGCLPKINPEALKELKNIFIIPGPIIDSIGPITDHLPWNTDKPYDNTADFSPATYPHRRIFEPEKIWNLKKGILFTFDRLLYRWTGICPPKRIRYYVKIASGCNRHCTYCAIRISRGRLRSQPLEWIVERVKDGVKAGFRDIVLIGTCVSSYGQDTGVSFPYLLRKLLEIDNSFRLYLRNLEPEDILQYLDEFTEILKTGRIVYAELQMQSGSNRILKLMNRGYTVEEFTKVIYAMKEANPKMHIRSQVMVGFPTETEEDFQQTVKLAGSLPFIYVEPFRFSARPGTPAARMEGHLDPKISKERYQKLKHHLERSQLSTKIKFAISYLIESLFTSPQAANK